MSRRDVQGRNEFFCELFPNHGIVNFKMLCAFMKNRIRGNMLGHLIITEEINRKRYLYIKISKKITYSF